METIKLTKNLWLHEYIPQAMYKDYAKAGKLHRLKGCIDERLVLLDQFLRTKFGAVRINDWHNGGKRTWSGLRTPGSPYYSETSQHSYGRASDKLFSDYSAEEVIEWMLKNKTKLHNEYYLGGLEVRATWVHSDVRYTDRLITFEP